MTLALGKPHSLTRPVRSRAYALSWASAAERLPRMVSACRERDSPASVSCILRPTRVNSGVPTARSSAFICCVMAGWVYPSRRAAAEYDPEATTA